MRATWASCSTTGRISRSSHLPLFSSSGWRRSRLIRKGLCRPASQRCKQASGPLALPRCSPRVSILATKTSRRCVAPAGFETTGRSLPGGALAFVVGLGLLDADQPVAVGVDLPELLVGAQELLARHVAVAVAVHLLEPQRPAGQCRPAGLPDPPLRHECHRPEGGPGAAGPQRQPR